MKEEGNFDREIVARRSYSCDVPYKNEIGDLEISDRSDEREMIQRYNWVRLS